ncbi:hypothetical protein HanIR_Chr15g0748261 [Helianthus annuus]|nr:hypothetical protein HanIR_Chr15g0748261 [Helianthus annuus]
MSRLYPTKFVRVLSRDIGIRFTVDWNKSGETAPKGLKKWLILSNKLN